MNAVPRLRLWPKSLAGQFILLALLALMAAQVVTVIVLLDERRSVLRAVAFDYVLDRTAGLHHLLSAAPDSLHDRLLESFSNPRIHFWLDDRPDLPSAPDQGPVALLADELSALTGVARTSIRVTAETRNWFHRDDHFGPRMGADTMPNHPWHRPQFSALTLALPLTDTSSAARTVWLVAQAAAPPPRRDRILAPLVSLALTGFALVIVIVFMTRRITRPLKALSQAADRFGRGQTVEPLAETGPGDLRATTASFNVMAARISRFVADRNHLLAAIAHDLRTPLTALRLQAEFVDDDETRSRILAILDDMTAMVEATLSLSREQAAEEPSRRLDLGDLVESLVQDFADMGGDARFEGAPGLVLETRPVALKRALRNLIENALRYGGSARVSLTQDGAQAVITVTDQGPGLPEDQLERAFEPFVRMETSRATETGGVGLGLAIARGLVRAMGGDITLANRAEGGLVAKVTLPV